MWMTEALRVVHRLSTKQAIEQGRTTKDNMLKRVCQWRVEEPEAFYEIVEMYQIGPACSITDVSGSLQLAFHDWRLVTDVATQFAQSYEWVSVNVTRLIRAEEGRLVREQRKTAAGVLWRLVLMPAPPSRWAES